VSCSVSPGSRGLKPSSRVAFAQFKYQKYWAISIAPGSTGDAMSHCLKNESTRFAPVIASREGSASHGDETFVSRSKQVTFAVPAFLHRRLECTRSVASVNKTHAASRYGADLPRHEIQNDFGGTQTIVTRPEQQARVHDDEPQPSTLETFKRHGVHPQLWVMQSSTKSAATLTDGQQVSQNAERIAALAKLAAPYGCRIGLYNHNGWFGILDHQLAILDRLQSLGVHDVGIVYNFSHARDPHHDDTIDFPSLWKKIQSRVMAVNVTGMRMEGQIIYPSQGDSELAMMRTIQDSGWRGPVGVIAEKGGDAEVTLKNYLTGIDWLAAELKQTGSGGPPPFGSATAH